VANPHDQYQQPFFLDAVKDSVFSNPNTPSLAVTQLLASCGSRILCELFNGSRNLLSVLALNTSQVF
jgi:hypothetical protein